MQITLTWQSVITAAAVVGAIIALVTYFSKVVRWFDKQKEQDKDIKEIKQHSKEIEQHHDDDIASIKHEQTLLVYGVLACLKGLREQGCNGPVTEAINRIEKYLNETAHHN